MKCKKLIVMFCMAVSMILGACGSTETQNNDNNTIEADTEINTEQEIVTVDFSESTNVSDDQVENSVDKNLTKEDQDADKVISENSVNEDSEKEADSDDKNDSSDEKLEPSFDQADINVYETPVTYYASEKLKIRKGPGTEFDVLGMLEINDEISVIGESKSSPWKQIKYGETVAFVHGNFIGTEKINLEALAAAAAEQAAAEKAAQEQAAAEQVAQAIPTPEPTPEPAPTPAPVQVINPSKVLMIGDSRTCQMKNASGGGGCDWICEYGTKFEWFRDTAVVLADTMVGKGTKVVICMGVNDPDNLSNYAAVVNQKAAEWTARGAKVYYVSINPVEPPYDFKNEDIARFNSSMPGMIGGVKWIDTATAVKNGNFVLEDGIHYDAVGNAAIFKMIYKSL